MSWKHAKSYKLSQFCAAVIISTNRLVLPELLGLPTAEAPFTQNHCPALLANGIFFGCLPLAELQSTDSLSQDGAATTPFFLPYLLKQICDVSTTEVRTRTRVSYVYWEQLISFCHVPPPVPQWDHHLREEGWSIITAFPVDLGDVGSVFCCDRLSLRASVT